MADTERVRVEIAFDGGQIMGAIVTAAGADALEQALGAADLRAGSGDAALSLDEIFVSRAAEAEVAVH